MLTDMGHGFEMRPLLGCCCLGAAFVALVLAFAIPLYGFPHQVDHLSRRTIDHTVGEARRGSTIPPLRLQILEAGQVPDAAGAYADGRLAWRTIFGVQYGETTIDGRSIHNEWHNRRMVGTVAVFALVEISLVVLAGWLFYTAP